jgi:hypothetical protein
MWDLENILGAVTGGDRTPMLVEVGRSLRGPESTVGYFWSTGRIQVTVGRGTVRLRRILGNVGLGENGEERGLQIDARQLQCLAVACEHWARHRHGWPAFYFTTAGYPPGYGGAEYYQHPGRRGKRVQVWSASMGQRRGTQLQGRDEARRVRPAKAIADGVVITHELWRVGERHGPREGSLVGLRYRFDCDLHLDAKREDARAWRTRGGSVHLEPGEEAFSSRSRKLSFDPTIPDRKRTRPSVEGGTAPVRVSRGRPAGGTCGTSKDAQSRSSRATVGAVVVCSEGGFARDVGLRQLLG